MSSECLLLFCYFYWWQLYTVSWFLMFGFFQMWIYFTCMYILFIVIIYIASKKETKDCTVLDFCEHGNIFDVIENVQQAPEAAVCPAHGYLMNFRGRNWTIWNDRQTHILDIFFKQNVPYIMKEMLDWRATTDAIHHRDGYTAVRSQGQLSDHRSGWSFHVYSQECTRTIKFCACKTLC